MGIKSDLDGTGNDEKPFFLETGTYLSRCRKIESAKSKNGPRSCFKFFWVPEDSAMKGLGATPLEYPQYEDELDANIPRDWAIIKALLGNPMKGPKGIPTWSGGLLMWNGLLQGEQVITGTVDVTIKTTPPNPKQKGGGYWDAKYKVEDYDPPGTNEAAAAEGLAACLDNEPTEEEAAEEQAARTASPARGNASRRQGQR